MLGRIKDVSATVRLTAADRRRRRDAVGDTITLSRPDGERAVHAPSDARTHGLGAGYNCDSTAMRPRYDHSTTFVTTKGTAAR